MSNIFKCFFFSFITGESKSKTLPRIYIDENEGKKKLTLKKTYVRDRLEY